MAALLWLVLGVVLAVAEAFTATFVLIMFAAGAFAAAIAAALGAPLALQGVVFAAVSVLSLLALRPIIKRHQLSAMVTGDEPIGLEALQGAPGLVVERVTTTSGRVKIEGEHWNARSFDATQMIEPGERIRVIEVRGATAIVWRDEFEDVLKDEQEANG